MQNIKNTLFTTLTQRQKSQLLGTLKAYFKKFSSLSKADIISKFYEDEQYYINIDNPHFEFMKDYFEDEKFYKDIERYIDFLEYENEQKKLMEPYINKQKELMKIQRKKAQEYKMSKLKPTKKQLFYYEKITKAHSKEMRDTTNASRLDLRNWIMEILDESDI